MTRTQTITIPWPEDQPTLSVFPEAGPLFGMERSASYDSAQRGDFPVRVLKCGNRLRVSTAEVRQILGLPVAKPADA